MQQAMHDLITPRVLSPAQIDALKKELKDFPNTPFDLAVTDDPDARNLVMQIGELLKDAGWSWKAASNMGNAVVFTMKDRPQVAVVSAYGLSIELAISVKPTLEKPAVTLLNGLLRSGIKATATAAPDDKFLSEMDKNNIHIFVGKR